MQISLKRACVSDAEELYELQIRSFKPLLDKYQDYKTNPGAEKIERTVGRLNESSSFYYFAQRAEINIGAVRIIDLGDLCQLKQIYILPEYQGHGYAQKAILLAEALHKNATSWELDTIKQEAKLCHLYEKMGYLQTGKEDKIKDGMDIIFYKK
jgi:GNAT superfamily N-acetyltransferase